MLAKLEFLWVSFEFDRTWFLNVRLTMPKVHEEIISEVREKLLYWKFRAPLENFDMVIILHTPFPHFSDCISVYFSGSIDVFSSWGGTRDSSSINWSWRWRTRAYIWVFLARKTCSPLLCSQVRCLSLAMHADSFNKNVQCVVSLMVKKGFYLHICV